MEKILNVLSLIVAAAVVVIALGSPFYFYNREKEAKEHVIKLESAMDSLEFVVTNMQKVDTLVFNIFDANLKSIETLGKEQTSIRKRVSNLEYGYNGIIDELDSYD